MTRALSRAAVLAAAIALAAVESSCDTSIFKPGSTVPGTCQTSPVLLGEQKTDILFVIDNSGSMRANQEGIASELPAFVSELQKGSGGLKQDFRVAVINTSVYQNAYINGGYFYKDYPNDSGHLQQVPPPGVDGGTAPGGEHYLNGDDPALLDKFARLVRQGTSGSGQETPFEALRLALTPPLSETSSDLGGTKGFLRDGAQLLVIVVSDEDDCSEMDRPAQVYIGNVTNIDYCFDQRQYETPVDTYFQIFNNLTDGTGARRSVLWGAIAPVGLTSKQTAPIIDNGQLRNVDCPTSFEPGYRHHEMAQKFDDSLRNLDSICDASYRNSLIALAEVANTVNTVDIMNVPDPRLLKVELTRADGHVDICTVDNGGISFEPGEGDRSPRIHFQGICARQPDDISVQVKLLCAG